LKIFKRILFVIMLCAFLFCLVQVAMGIYASYVAKNDYDESKDIAKLPEMTRPPETTKTSDTAASPEGTGEPDTTSSATPEAVPEDEIALTLLRETDLASLKAVNPDVIGWIVIPETNISFPLVQGVDNDHYLHHTWAGRWSWSGSIFLDYHVQSDFTDYNTIIYGHNMGGGEMFSDLLLYRDQSFYNDHPSVYIVTENLVQRYDIFSVYESDLESDKTFTVNFSTEEKKNEYLERCKDRSEITCDDPKKGEGLITLATCTQTGYYDYKTRWVVQAYLAYSAKGEQ